MAYESVNLASLSGNHAVDTVGAQIIPVFKLDLGGDGLSVPVINYVPIGSAVTGLGDGRQTVTTAGTRVQVSASSVTCKQLTITALSTNTGVIVVGSSTVIAASGTRRGTPLLTGDTIVLDIDNLNKVYIDSTVNGEGVSYLYTT